MIKEPPTVVKNLWLRPWKVALSCLLLQEGGLQTEWAGPAFEYGEEAGPRFQKLPRSSTRNSGLEDNESLLCHLWLVIIRYVLKLTSISGTSWCYSGIHVSAPGLTWKHQTLCNSLQSALIKQTDRLVLRMVRMFTIYSVNVYIFC